MNDWKDILGAFAASANLPEGEPASNPTPAPASTSKKKETLRVIIDKKGRKGKVATIVEGFECDDDTLDEIAATLKRKLGVGGSARGGEILIQGNCADKVAGLLREMNYKVK